MSGAVPASAAPSAPDVSIIVPTRDRPAALAVCLAALEGQDLPRYEIVVVDDASRDAAAVAAVVAQTRHARLVAGAGRGPAAARNSGAAAAHGGALCFTDDDCEPVPGWAAALVDRLRPDVAAAAGPTRSAGPGSLAAAAQAVASHTAESTIDPVTDRMGFAPTSNLACRADVWRRLPFDESYPLAAGEDRDWCARLLASGQALVYEPAAVVWHHQDLTLRAFWRQQVRYGRGAHRYRRSHGVRRPPPPGFYTGLLRRAVAEGGIAAGALVAVAQVATVVGALAEARRGSR